MSRSFQSQPNIAHTTPVQPSIPSSLPSAAPSSNSELLHQAMELPTPQEVHVTQIPTVTYVPKAARGEWSRLLIDELSSTINNPSVSTQWTKLLMLPRAILASKGGSKAASDARSSAAMVKDRIKKWRSGDVATLWAEAKEVHKPSTSRRRKQQPNVPTQDDLNASRALRFVAEGQYSRAAQALMSEGVAPTTPHNILVMKDKHPQAAVPPLHPDQEAQPLSLLPSEVYKAIKNFK